MKSSLSIILVICIHKQACIHYICNFVIITRTDIKVSLNVKLSLFKTNYAMTAIIVIFRDLLERVDQLEKLDLKDYK